MPEITQNFPLGHIDPHLVDTQAVSVLTELGATDIQHTPLLR